MAACAAAQLGSRLRFLSAMAAYCAILAATLLIMRFSVGREKVVLLVKDMISIAALAFTIATPIYALMTHLSLEAAFAIILLLVLAVCASLAVAGIYLSTTSFAALIRRTPFSPELKTLLAITMTYFPRFEEDIRGSLLAFKSLEWSPTQRWRPSLRPVYRVYFTVCANLWSIVTVRGIHMFLSVCERFPTTKELKVK
jgi:hypothetical protein